MASSLGQDANVNIQATGNVTLTSALTNPSAIGSDTGVGAIVVNSTGGSIIVDALSRIRGDSVALSANGDVTLGNVVATKADVGGVSALSVTAGAGAVKTPTLLPRLAASR